MLQPPSHACTVSLGCCLPNSLPRSQPSIASFTSTILQQRAVPKFAVPKFAAPHCPSRHAASALAADSPSTSSRPLAEQAARQRLQDPAQVCLKGLAVTAARRSCPICSFHGGQRQDHYWLLAAKLLLCKQLCTIILLCCQTTRPAR